MLTKQLLCVGVLMLTATALRADVFYFSYSGPGVSASGTVSAKKAGNSGLYTITDIDGSRNGETIGMGNGVFYDGSSLNPPLNAGGMSFTVKGVFGLANVTYVGGVYKEIFVGKNGGTTTLNSFGIGSSVPEPSVLLLVFTMGLAIWVLARKMPLKKSPTR